MVTRAEPRSAALEMLKRTRHGFPLDATLPDTMHALSPKDKRLAHEIAAGVLRNRRVIDREIQHRLAHPESPLSDTIHDILRIGAYQLYYLDRVPSYAAVSSAVNLARAEGGKKTAGLVNAILRNIDRSGSVIDTTASTIAERYSHPDWLVSRWEQNFGASNTERLLGFFNTRRHLVLQAARWTEETLRDALHAAGVNFTTSSQHEGIAVESRDVRSLPGYREGGFIVQDPAQRELLDFAAIPKNVSVWDVCAAPGGKAVTLAQQCRVVATDVSHARTKFLRENRDRVARSTNIAVVDATRAPFRDASFDVVLVDAPCSGTGSMARHPDARWSLTPDRIRNVTVLQRDILDAVARHVKPGGLLVYLTCSLEPEENQHQVDRFLEENASFERTSADLSIFPPDHGMDGGYGARMTRSP